MDYGDVFVSVKVLMVLLQDTKEINVVYRSKTGGVGLISPN